MNSLPGLAVIFGFLALGEGLSFLLGLPVPGSVIGMVLFAAALGLRLVREETVKAPAEFLGRNLSFFFVPAGVGLMAYFSLLEKEWLPILASTIAGTLFTLIAVALFHSFAARRGRRDR